MLLSVERGFLGTLGQILLAFGQFLDGLSGLLLPVFDSVRQFLLLLGKFFGLLGQLGEPIQFVSFRGVEQFRTAFQQIVQRIGEF